MPPTALPGPLLAWGAAVAGIALLLAAALAGTPPAPALADVPAHEGNRVLVTGRVAQATPFEGATRLILTDGGYRLEVWARGDGVPAARGDEVAVTGTVRAEGGRFSLAADARDVQVLAAAGDVVLRPAELAESPARYAGTPVRAEGLVVREDGAWWLRDPWANRALRLDAEAAPTAGPATVDGLLRYAPQWSAYVLEVTAWTPQAPRHSP